MVIVTCSQIDCDKRAEARGLCSTHYYRLRTYGDPSKLGPRGARGAIIADPLERFWSKVDKREGGCWYWQGNRRRRGGYGSMFWQGSLQSSHRIAYQILIGPIPDGLVLDHLCREPACVNPDHLEPVTVAENSSRARRGKLATECSSGHPMSGHNLVLRKDGARYCRSCFNERQQSRRAGYRAERRILTALAAMPFDYEPDEPLVAEVLDAINAYFDARFADSEWNQVFSATT